MGGMDSSPVPQSPSGEFAQQRRTSDRKHGVLVHHFRRCNDDCVSDCCWYKPFRIGWRCCGSDGYRGGYCCRRPSPFRVCWQRTNSGTSTNRVLGLDECSRRQKIIEVTHANGPPTCRECNHKLLQGSSSAACLSCIGRLVLCRKSILHKRKCSRRFTMGSDRYPPFNRILHKHFSESHYFMGQPYDRHRRDRHRSLANQTVAPEREFKT
jgi:hypothetical protein